MEFGLREWMILIGVLLILAVVLDGFRRMRQSRQGRIRMALKPVPGNLGDLDELTGELPNGGARVLDRQGGTPSPERRRMPSWRSGRAPAQRSPEPEDDTTLDDLQDQVPPMLMDFVGSDAESFSALDDEADLDVRQPDLWGEEEPKPARREAPEPVEREDVEVVVLNVLPKDRARGFGGKDIMHIFEQCDVRFGHMNIFHRHEQANGMGPIQFSVANMVEPGTFDLDAMEDFESPGLCFFMQLPGPREPLDAFRAMAEIAQLFVRHLNGELRDQYHSAVTAQTLEHSRQRISEFERRRRLAATTH